ncbi:LysM peptidoglycan-binding domain-containing protein [Bacillus sp. CGMCC 1.16607]|uniref:LysM peptidoglycan-binding domain-containing protein n=1 Tax=Bacillus sp. CGMCC 1.16607 TaxID=3351842 RepID=UPI00363A688A
MNKEEPYRDQAERLRQKIEKTKSESEAIKELPTRSDLHRHKKKKTKWKLKYPVIRLLVLFFILLPIAIFSAISTLSERSEKVNSEKNGYEEVNFENENKEEIENSKIDIDNVESRTEDTEEKDLDISSEEVQQNEQTTNETTEQSNLPSTENSDINSNSLNEESQEKEVYHTVQSMETLYRIAMKYYQSQTGIEKIREANQLSGNEIHVGQVLKIPK